MKLVPIISLAWIAATAAWIAAGAEPADDVAEAPTFLEEAEPIQGEWINPEGEQEVGFLAEAEGLTFGLETLEPAAEETEAPNEMVFDGFVIRGAAVQWIKTDNLLQLFNPFAPARYGSGEQNLAHDAITGKPKGLILFAIDIGLKKDSR
jgi:hypothetical protein